MATLSQIDILSALKDLSTTSIAAYAAGFVAVLTLTRSVLYRNKYPVPPGPKGWPLLGNIFDMPSVTPWKVYLEWSKTYNSDIISLKLPGKYLIILNSTKAVNDLMNKKSSIYSDRPQSTMLSQLMELTWVLGMMRYGNEWKNHRKHFRAQFEHKGNPIVRQHELLCARRLLSRLLKNKSGVNYASDLQLSTADTILSVTYGFSPKSTEDHLIHIAENLVSAMAVIGGAGYLVDMYPILRYVPEWFPGAGFQKKARELKSFGVDARNVAFDRTKDEVAKGIAPPSVAAVFLSSMKSNGADDHMEGVMRDILAEAYLGGAGASVGNLCTFILAMVFHPEVQKKAQAEIDAVTNKEILPDFSHKIPYIDALVEETLRWHPGAPLGVFHSTTQDDYYEGYFIPKGSIISPNVYAYLRDKEVYGEDVEEFNPSRFLDAQGDRNDVPDADAAFGLGRRICAGRGMAREILWITMASILAVYDITNPVDADGKSFTLDSIEYSNATSSRPPYFDCTFTRRAGISESLILSGTDAE